jgi:endonuclease YncB( thermonuclease family)
MNINIKQKLFAGLIVVLLAFFVDGTFSFLNNPKLEKELLNELTLIVNNEFNKIGGYENNILGESTEDSRDTENEIVLVKRVVDADTIELSSNEKLRYIGINAPETKHPTKEVECFGEVASLKNKELVEGKEVRLEKDISNTDRYGRLLRYVYVVDNTLEENGTENNINNKDKEIFVNEYLVREGYAKASSYPPDIKYQELFKSAENQARALNKGLWGDECAN